MAVLLSMEGKYYDVPDDQAAAFEVPREKVRDVLAHSPMPAMERGTPGPGSAPRGARGAPGGGSPVIIQVLPNGIHGPAQGSGQGPGQSQGPGGQPEGEVDPYWYTWWTNWNNWANYW